MTVYVPDYVTVISVLGSGTNEGLSPRSGRGLPPSLVPTMGDLWEKQDEKVDKKKERDVSKKKNRNVYFCVAYLRYFSTSIYRVINRLKKVF